MLGPDVPMAVLSGPTFASEVGAGLPSAMTVASRDEGYAMSLARSFSGENFRAYASGDMIGVEVGGAIKNVLAIGAGHLRRPRLRREHARRAHHARARGDDAARRRARRGRETFMGLAGLGDLVLTCTDNQSRNRRFGLALAAGKTPEQAQAEIGQVVEGVLAARAVHEVARRVGVVMPISEEIYRVLYEGAPAKDAVYALMGRTVRSERTSTNRAGLPPGLVHGDRHRVRQVQAARRRQHRNAHAAIRGALRQQLVRQAARLRAEHQRITVRVIDRVVADGAAGREGEPARPAQAREAVGEARVLAQVGEFAVVQARPPHGPGVQAEAERPHEVQARPRVRAQPDDVAGVGRNLRLDQDDVHWHRIGSSCASRFVLGDPAMLLVKHLLARKGTDIWSIDAAEPVLSAVRMMAEHHVGALPVLRDGRLAGIVSERDYARKVVLLGRASADTPVSQIMSSPVVTVGLDDRVHRCMQLMTEKRFRHLPVVDAGGAMVGVISIGDLVRAVIEEQKATIEQLEKFIVG